MIGFVSNPMFHSCRIALCMTNIALFGIMLLLCYQKNSIISALPSECNQASDWNKLNRYQLVDPLVMPTWGSYRPDIYFGMKTKTIPDAISTGIFWNSNLRHKIRHESTMHELLKLQWTRHDGIYFGDESIVDNENNLEIEASFKVLNNNNDEDDKIDLKYKPNWIQQLSLNSITTTAIESRKNLYYYFGVDCNFNNNDNTCLRGSKMSLKYLTTSSTSDNNIGISIGGSSVHSSQFILYIKIALEKNSDNDNNNVCLNSQNCDVTDIIDLSYWTGKDKDVWGHVAGIGAELESRQMMNHHRRHLSQSDHLYMDEEGNFINNFSSSSSSFIAFKISSLTSFKVQVSYFDNMSYRDKSDFDAIVRLLDDDMNTQLFDLLLSKSRSKFDERFEHIFQLKSKFQPDFDNINNHTIDNHNEVELNIAKIALSSLLGGIGYFHGVPEIGDGLDVNNDLNSIQKNPSDKSKSKTNSNTQNAVTLLTATPSRTVFPRGFLWDEGFHQMLISKWDPLLSLTMMNHWFQSMYFYQGKSKQCQGGWIPREMILGNVARNRVPSEFMTQRVNIANPPTFMLVIEYIMQYQNDLIQKKKNSSSNTLKLLKADVDSISTTINKIQTSLKALYPALDAWIQWYISSQSSTDDDITGTFRWRGRSISDQKVIPNTLSSGLDDYPRSALPTSHEAHVDLMSWMISACRIMNTLSLQIGKDGKYYKQKYEYYQNKLNTYHWFDAQSKTESVSDENKNPILWSSYYDIGLDSPKNQFYNAVTIRCGNKLERTGIDIQIPMEYMSNVAEICPPNFPTPMYPHADQSGNIIVLEKYYTIPPENMTRTAIPRIGYVNLFPFILQTLDSNMESTKILAILDIIENEDLLWTNYGLRSIAKSDLFYQRRNAPGDAPYWRYFFVCVVL